MKGVVNPMTSAFEGMKSCKKSCKICLQCKAKNLHEMFLVLLFMKNRKK